MKKIILSLLGVGALLLCAFFWLNHYIYDQRQPAEPSSKRVTLTGEYVCLPLRNNRDIADTDCAVGFHAETGEYYALDLGLMSQGVPQLVAGNRLTASGVLTSIEMLNTDYWNKYPVVGIFSVTDSLEVLSHDVQVSSPILQTWIWKATDKKDGTVITAKDEAFVLSFSPDQTYTSTGDCNSFSGTFIVDHEVLSLSPAVGTMMFCEGSQETEYITELARVNSFVIEGTQLRLNLADDSVMTFEGKRP